jgi:hypothetical protein
MSKFVWILACARELKQELLLGNNLAIGLADTLYREVREDVPDPIEAAGVEIDAWMSDPC